jgi:hypothetical protein
VLFVDVATDAARDGMVAAEPDGTAILVPLDLPSATGPLILAPRPGGGPVWPSSSHRSPNRA